MHGVCTGIVCIQRTHVYVCGNLSVTPYNLESVEVHACTC